ncbi:HNH endonuclease [Salmonella enterica]|nr:HNH endonuclease [Salmonella enterica]
MSKPYEDPQLLRELFAYDAESGRVFHAKTRTGQGCKIKAGAPADTHVNTCGYHQLSATAAGRRHRPMAHRVAWILHHGKPIPDGMQVDHINGIRTDNRIENLRLVTHTENQHNQRKAKGYTWNTQCRKWRAQIRVGGKHKTLGLYATELEARAAYMRAKRELHPTAPLEVYH